MYYNEHQFLIQTIKVLEKEDLKIINDYVDTLSFSENYVFSKDGSSRIDTSARSSLGSTMDDSHPATSLLNQKINDSLWEYKSRLCEFNSTFNFYPVPGGIDTYAYREGLQVLEYTSNQEYKFHHDAANEPDRKEYHRQISVVLYLNGGFEGGGTEFIHKTYKPDPGYALIFPSNWCFPHSGQKVISGKKRVAVTWYYVTINS